METPNPQNENENGCAEIFMMGFIFGLVFIVAEAPIYEIINHFTPFEGNLEDDSQGLFHNIRIFTNSLIANLAFSLFSVVLVYLYMKNKKEKNTTKNEENNDILDSHF